MFVVRNGRPNGLRWGLFALTAVIVLTVVGADPADARRRKRLAAGGGYNPPYAAIVVDANSGAVMHSSNADSTRHPASLTKIMTLYLLFEQIEAGKLKLNSEIEMSAHASRQAPSKLGLRPGSTIDVEDAIKALVTKSANDVAVAVGEAIGGDEEDFAKLMTRKARSLGMSRTTYTNASGLPDPDQVTTARDQAILGRAIQDRFPKLYKYFSTRMFHYRGRGIANHNKLLGRVAGIDGIKTGFIRASGFNLVASMRRNDRHVVAVVMGGASGRSRDTRMHQLLEGHIVEASVRRTAPRITEIADASEPRSRQRVAAVEESEMPRARKSAPETVEVVETRDPRIAPQVVAEEPVAKPEPVRRTPQMVVASAMPSFAAGSAEPIQPNVVRTITVRRGAAAQAAAPQGAYQTASAAPPSARPGTLGTLTMRQMASAGEAVPVAASETSSPARPNVRGEWIIQIGAYPEEDKAKEKLKSAQSVARSILAAAAPFTEPVMKGSTTLYRARFAGFDQDRAEAACKYLKQNEFACLALKN